MTLNEAEKHALILFRLARASETLKEAHAQVELGFWRLAVNRQYYACFYAVSALLVARGEYPRTHKGLRQRFAALFVATGEFPQRLADAFTDLFERRNSGDYDDFVEVGPEVVDRLFPLA